MSKKSVTELALDTVELAIDSLSDSCKRNLNAHFNNDGKSEFRPSNLPYLAASVPGEEVEDSELGRVEELLESGAGNKNAFWLAVNTIRDEDLKSLVKAHTVGHSWMGIDFILNNIRSRVSDSVDNVSYTGPTTATESPLKGMMVWVFDLAVEDNGNRLTYVIEVHWAPINLSIATNAKPGEVVWLKLSMDSALRGSVMSTPNVKEAVNRLQEVHEAASRIENYINERGARASVLKEELKVVSQALPNRKSRRK